MRPTAIEKSGPARRYARSTLAAVMLGLIWLAAAAAADGIYQYRRSDGVWVFTDNPNELPPEARREVAKRFENRSAQVRDLAAQLARQNPRNPIEAAVLGTVAVKSGKGMGSGFFVTEDGFLITNRHVVRTPAQVREARTERIERIDTQAETFYTRLEAEQQRLDAALAELEGLRRRMRSADYAQNRGSLDRWQQDLDRRRREIQDQHETLRRRQTEAEARDRITDLERVFDVLLADNTALRAFLVAEDERWDLALLKVDGYRVPRLTPAAPGQTATGEPVYAVGNPAALRNSVSKGVLSGYEGGWIKTDAKIYPGNSGGPLVDAAGRVLGINTFKELTERFEGLGFAVPIQTAYQVFGRHLPATP
mgnify:CR=1 FL=1